MEESTQEEKCKCKSYQRRLEKLRKKYSTLKNKHKIILDVTVRMTQHLEKCVMGEVDNEIFETLQYCARMFADLRLQEAAMSGENQTEIFELDDYAKGLPDIESVKEYYKGFLARPKIPRTPQDEN